MQLNITLQPNDKPYTLLPCTFIPGVQVLANVVCAVCCVGASDSVEVVGVVVAVALPVEVRSLQRLIHRLM